MMQAILLSKSTRLHNLVDGNWNFKIFLRDSFLRLSNQVEQILTFDTSPPKVIILVQNHPQNEL